MKRIDVLKVECPEGVVVKKVDFNQDELDNVVKLETGAKVNAVVLIDRGVHSESAREIEWKRIRKQVDKLEVYAVNKSNFKILFGFGGYSFEERRSGIHTNLGFSGSCLIAVNTFKEFLNAFDNSEEVSEEEINDLVRAKVCEIVKGAIGEELHRVRRDEVESVLNEIRSNEDKDGLMGKLRAYFLTKGMTLKEVTLRVNYPDDFVEKYQDYADKEAESRQAQKEFERIKALNKD